jgi:hypothetical protein
MNKKSVTWQDSTGVTLSQVVLNVTFCLEISDLWIYSILESQEIERNIDLLSK